MAIALVQSVLGGHNSGSFGSGGGTLACTGNFPISTTTGNFIAIVCFTSSTGTFNALNIASSFSGATLNASGGFLNQQNAPLWKGTGIFFTSGNVASISSGTTLTYTATISGISSGTANVVNEMCLFEFSGCLQSGSPLAYVDVGTSGNGTSSTPNLGTVVTSASDLMLGAFVGVTGNISAGPGYLLGQTMSTVQFAQVQYALNVAAGNVPTAWSGTEAKWGAFAYAILPPATPPPPTKVRLINGNFQDSLGNPVSNGYLLMSPSADAAISGVTTQICSGIPIKINLDNTANVAANQSVWGTDNMTPSNLTYEVMLFRSDGTPAWNKPQFQTITGTPTFNTSTWIPN